jgi:hypothetical protein
MSAAASPADEAGEPLQAPPLVTRQQAGGHAWAATPAAVVADCVTSTVPAAVTAAAARTAAIARALRLR